MPNIISKPKTQNAIELNDLWKRYYLNTADRPRTLKKAIFSRFNYWSTRESYWALQGVNLTIPKGRTTGLIGNNGAGKSTLLRLISGLSRPTKGQVLRQGSLGTLLELGAGFNYEFTGRENVLVGSILAGLTRREAESRMEKVIDFAELRDFIDSPVRTYSSGMFVRLAFSTEIHLDPDILLIDEVLAVGDLAFQKKCLNHLLDMKARGKTIIVVSHAMHQIETICDEVVWLEHGRVRAQGDTKEIVTSYRNRVFQRGKPSEEPATKTEQPVAVGATSTVAPTSTKNTAPVREQRSGLQPLKLNSVHLLNEHGQQVSTITSGDPMLVQVSYTATEPIEQPAFMIGIFNEEGVKCYEIGNQEEGAFFGQITGTGSFSLSFSHLTLMRGSYHLSVGAYPQSWDFTYDYLHRACELQVEGATKGSGIFYPAHRWQVD